MIKLDTTKLITACLNASQMTQIELGQKVNDTQGNISRRINNSDIKINSVLTNYLDALGYDIEIRAINRKTGIAISIDNINRDSSDKSNSD